MIPLTTVFPPLIAHPYQGAWLRISADLQRRALLERHVSQLKSFLVADDPQVGLAVSWSLVSRGLGFSDRDVLLPLAHAEQIIRTHFPNARAALALNLASQGCHVRALGDEASAIRPLTEAFEMMTGERRLVCEADLVKVAETLSRCLTECSRFDAALLILARAQPLYLAACEQRAGSAVHYDEFREEFIEHFGSRCSSGLKPLVDSLKGPRILTEGLTVAW